MSDGVVFFMQVFIVLTVISVVTAMIRLVGRWLRGE